MEANLNEIGGRCEHCQMDGIVHVTRDEWEKSFYVVCEECGWQTAYVNCPKCEIGGWLATNDFSKHHLFWKCSECYSKWDLPATFYEKAHKLKLLGSKATRQSERVMGRIALGLFALIILTIIGWAIYEFVLKGL